MTARSSPLDPGVRAGHIDLRSWRQPFDSNSERPLPMLTGED
jgi:hypothetical protein